MLKCLKIILSIAIKLPMIQVYLLKRSVVAAVAAGVVVHLVAVEVGTLAHANHIGKKVVPKKPLNISLSE